MTSTRGVTLVCVADEGPRPLDPASVETSLEATRRSVRAQSEPDVDLAVVSSFADAASVVAAAPGWVGFVDVGDVLTADAIARMAAVTDANPDVVAVYSDETIADETTGSRAPFHKPAWSPDRLRCQPYTGRLTILRADRVREVGGLHPELVRCAEHDLVLRVGESVGESTDAVSHVAAVLCHRGPSASPLPSFDAQDTELACRVLDSHLERTGIQAVARAHATASGLLRLEPRLRSRPLVSIVIPTGGARRTVRGVDTDLVVNCVRSIVDRSTYEEIEMVCVLDEAVGEATRRGLRAVDPGRVSLVEFAGPFHFSRKVNHGVLATRGDVIVILNDDTEVRTPEWIEAMLIYALDDAVGAVGARLLFEDERIQHMAVVGVGGNPGHPYHGLPETTVGHGGNALVPGNFIAVTGACLMTRRDRFDAVGGMSPWFPANYNDLDFCLKLRAAGARVVATPDAVLSHFESSSRSGAVASEELELIRRRWGRLLRADPFYGPNFPSGIADFEPALSTP